MVTGGSFAIAHHNNHRHSKCISPKNLSEKCFDVGSFADAQDDGVREVRDPSITLSMTSRVTLFD